MTTGPLAFYQFIPWIREGFSTAITSDVTTKRAEFDIEVEVKSTGGGIIGNPAKTVQLFGPGDVLNIDPDIVARVYPKKNTMDAEPNYLVFLDFPEIDFLWRFTPTPPDANGNLKPWLTLLVLKKIEVETFSGGKNLPPSITITGGKLPDLNNAWRWAHIQVANETEVNANSIQDLVKAHPERAVCRLMSSKRLDPKTAYHAFVVPTFLGGVQAGLGQPLGPSASELAWQGTSATTKLPFYYDWEFTTGERGDFEYLIRLLEARKLEKMGIQEIKCDDPGYNLASLVRTDPDAQFPDTLGLEGALMSLDTKVSPWGQDQIYDGYTPLAVPDFQTKLADDVLNQPKADQVSGSSITPKVGPPIYGRWHAGKDEVTTGSDTWFDALNLDPRHRAVAGFGTKAVRQHQEQLMQSAWDQIGLLDEANAVFRRAQLGCRGSTPAYNRLVGLPQGDFLRFASPVNAKVPIKDDTTGEVYTPQKFLAENPPVEAALDPAFRRILRAGGGLRKRQKKDSNPNRKDILERLNNGEISAADPHPDPAGFPDLCELSLGLFGDLLHATKDEQLIQIWSWLFEEEKPAQPSDWLLCDKNIDGKTIEEIIKGFCQSNLALFRDILKATRDEELIQKWGWLLSEEKPADLPEWLLCEKNIDCRSLETFINELEVLYENAMLEQGTAPPPRENHFPDDDRQDPILAEIKSILDRIKKSRFLEEFCSAFSGWSDYSDEAGEVYNPVDLDEIETALKAALDPEKSIPARANWQYNFHDVIEPEDPCGERRAIPGFPQPTYELLLNLSKDLLLPGTEYIQQNTIGLLKTNPRFVESYMCGMNNEFAGEALWREFPTVLNGTFFRQFWDVVDFVPTDTFLQNIEQEISNETDPGVTLTPEQIGKLVEAKVTDEMKDITPLKDWRDNQLGENGSRLLSSSENYLVLIVRGLLFQKYPNTVVTAVKAHYKNCTDGERAPALYEFLECPDDKPELLDKILQDHPPMTPIFGGSIAPDIRFFGFELTEAEALGGDPANLANDPINEGWYFCLEERPGETRLGMDVPLKTGTPDLKTWDDLNWDHVGINPNQCIDDFLDGSQSGNLPKPTDDDGGVTWDQTSAHLAWILSQKPVRICIHAKKMIPKKTTTTS